MIGGLSYWEGHSTGSSPFTWTCPEDVGTQMPVSDEEIAELLVKALTDTVTQPTYHGERRWASLSSVYELLAHNDTVRGADSLLIAFHDSCRTANIGKLLRAGEVAAWPMVMGPVGKLIPMPDFMLNYYLDTLGNMTPSGTPEETLRDVLVIELEKHKDTTTVVDSIQLGITDMLAHLFPDSTFAIPRMKKGYSSGQIATLTAIAEECPSEHGTAVYMARAMLSALDTIPYTYWHECEEVQLPPSERRGEGEEQDTLASEDGRGFTVYPNPANATLTVQGTLAKNETATFELHTVTGSKVKEILFQNVKTEVDVSDLPSGLYFYRIHVNHQQIHTGKQVIIR